ncbi:MAG: competence-specific regulator [Oceanospirillaceae bacterium]|jgi:DNA transformation protein|nr:competence-specific regulator [Oceanospirillaceae bacterium]|tara:strand:+ start:474 stop:782 length:309 start_codon:yes stop_codon:yes gene_type:complete
MSPKYIRDLPGLGEKSEQSLALVGITDVEQLRSCGAVMAFYRLQQLAAAEGRAKPSLNFLYALVGGLSNRSWLTVAQSERERLLMELEGISEMERMFQADSE